MSTVVTATAASKPPYVLLASNEQLNDVIKRINPFEANFREANKHICSGAVNSDASSFDDPPSAKTNSATIAASVLYGESLLIKLPPYAEFLSGGASATAVFNANMETPDLSSLINQAIKNGSPIIPSPLTADILKTALEMRETAESRRLGDSVATPSNSSQSHHSSVLLRLNSALQPFLERQLSLTLAELQTPVKDSTRLKFTDDEDFLPSCHSGRLLQKPSALEDPQVVAAAPYVCVPIKVGEQFFYVPVAGDANSVNSALSKTPPCSSYLCRTEMGGSAQLPLANQICSPTSPHLSLQSNPSCNFTSPEPHTFDDQRGRKSRFSSPEPYLELEKRKDSLERNKEAAWRYRKRKKEEKWTLEERAKILEGEKAELLAQVSILKSELTRVNQILREHNCPVLGTHVSMKPSRPTTTFDLDFKRPSVAHIAGLTAPYGAIANLSFADGQAASSSAFKRLMLLSSANGVGGRDGAVAQPARVIVAAPAPPSPRCAELSSTRGAPAHI